MQKLIFFGEIRIKGLFPCLNRAHHGRKAVIGLRANDQVHNRLTAHNLFAFGLRDTARNTNFQIGVVIAQRFQAAQFRIDLFRCLLANVARIQQDHIRFFRTAHLLITLTRQRLCHTLAVIDIHLAAIGFHE